MSLYRDEPGMGGWTRSELHQNTKGVIRKSAGRVNKEQRTYVLYLHILSRFSCVQLKKRLNKAESYRSGIQHGTCSINAD